MDSHTFPKIVLVIVGPTAVGKTFLSTLIARKLPVEIVSADSRQIYKHLNIGTAKPSREILERIPHHFVDILEPDQEYSAGQFGNEARGVIAQIFQRNHVPLVLGGSGLYIRALLEGFFDNDVKNEKIRESLEHRLQEEGLAALYRDLQKVDPAAARKIHPHNSQRIIRALEVFLASGHRLSELQRKKLPPPDFTALKFGLMKERNALYRDINDRVDQMFREGLLAEVARILDMGFEKNLNALNTVGYKEVISFLEGQITFEECVDLIKRNSRHYAKRQLTWFRADLDIRWMTANKPEDFPQVAEQIVRIYQEEAKNLRPEKD